jgi:hypothetical protein
MAPAVLDSVEKVTEVITLFFCDVYFFAAAFSIGFVSSYEGGSSRGQHYEMDRIRNVSVCILRFLSRFSYRAC